jgi:Pyruvate/2-oxoacid:ferredoxin oxidoreductase delta subunit
MELNFEISEMQECLNYVHVICLYYCDDENVNEWLHMNINDPGYQILSGCGIAWIGED